MTSGFLWLQARVYLLTRAERRKFPKKIFAFPSSSRVPVQNGLQLFHQFAITFPKSSEYFSRRMRISFLFGGTNAARLSELTEGEAVAHILPVVFSYLVEQTNELDFATAASIAAEGRFPFWDPISGATRTAAVFNNETRVEIDPTSFHSQILPKFGASGAISIPNCLVHEFKYKKISRPYLPQIPAVCTRFQKAWADKKNEILFQGVDPSRNKISNRPLPNLSEEAGNCVAETVGKFLSKFDWASPEKFHRQYIDEHGCGHLVCTDFCIGHSTLSLHTHSVLGASSFPPVSRRIFLFQLLLGGRDEWEHEERNQLRPSGNFLGVELAADGPIFGRDGGPSVKLIHFYPEILDNIVNAEVQAGFRDFTFQIPDHTRCLHSGDGRNRDTEIERGSRKPNPDIIQRCQNLTERFLTCWEERKVGRRMVLLEEANEQARLRNELQLHAQWEELTRLD